MIISVLPDPEAHPLWPGIYELLEPAARLGNVPVLEENELVWVVIDSGEIIAAATTRVTIDRAAEIILCGGARAREWAVPLSDMICQWADDEGADRVVLAGRRGWARLLDWPEVDSQIVRRLHVEEN